MPITSIASEFGYPRILNHPWDHSPITVYINNKTVPLHYSPTYYADIEKALNYWAGGGNGKLKYIPVFEIVNSEDTDIRIKWDANLQKDQGAPHGVAGETIRHIANGRFVYVNIILGVGNHHWNDWVPLVIQQ